MNILHPTDLDFAAHAIEEGELVVVPTNRWYMICCNASNANACARIYHAKRRPESKSLLLVLPSKNVAYNLFQISHEADTLIESLWPGDLALLLRWSNAEMGLTYSAVGSEIALVNHPGGVMGALAERTSVLIAATSANISEILDDGSGGPAINVSEVIDFAKKTGTELAAIIDGGICPQFTHMTIVDCSDRDAPSQFVRDGTVHRRAVAAALCKEVQP